jgi:hypothetical protein
MIEAGIGVPVATEFYRQHLPVIRAIGIGPLANFMAGDTALASELRFLHALGLAFGAVEIFIALIVDVFPSRQAAALGCVCVDGFKRQARIVRF